MDDALDLLSSEADSDSELEDEVLIPAALAVGVSISLYSAHFDKIAVHTSLLSGELWLEELLNGHDRRFHNELGMNKFAFRRLIAILGTDAGLHATRHVSAAEQIAIFLHYARRGLSNWALQERFQRSADTITK